jgi:hypothetical protein
MPINLCQTAWEYAFCMQFAVVKRAYRSTSTLFLFSASLMHEQCLHLHATPAPNMLSTYISISSTLGQIFVFFFSFSPSCLNYTVPETNETIIYYSWLEPPSKTEIFSPTASATRQTFVGRAFSLGWSHKPELNGAASLIVVGVWL